MARDDDSIRRDEQLLAICLQTLRLLVHHVQPVALLDKLRRDAEISGGVLFPSGKPNGAVERMKTFLGKLQGKQFKAEMGG